MIRRCPHQSGMRQGIMASEQPASNSGSTAVVARQRSGKIGYWASFEDERGLRHYAFTSDPAYADLSPANAASRTAAIGAFGRAIERCRIVLAAICSSDGTPRRR